MDDGQRGICEVEGLAACVCGEECGVTLCCGLNDLIFHREEVCGVFTRNGVGMDDDALLFEKRIGRAALDDCLHQSITCKVIGVMNDVGCVVTFQHQD